MSTATHGGWIEEIPAVDIEMMENGNVRITDKSCLDQDYSVDLHPIHLRLIAERMGLAREMSASEADALRMVDKLARRLKLLHGRIKQLQKWLADAPDMENADINAEYWFNDATLDLATEFIREIDESGAVITPRHTESRDMVRTDSVSGENPVGTGVATETKPIGSPAGTRRVSKVGQLALGIGHE